jgi:D-alanyl-D-alanine dipeptidase
MYTQASALAGERPRDIIDATTVIPDLALDLRYAGSANFIGRPIAGYRVPKCYLTKRAAEALKGVQAELGKQGLGLKVYDCYRPQRAVNDFVKWSRNRDDEKMKAQFYPNVEKRNLFRESYIAHRSGHSRGSTVDLTIVPLPAAQQPAYDASKPLASCEGAKEARAPDTSLDMGTGFDCFSPRSHTAYSGIGPEPRKNRQLLKSVMSRHGFRNLSTEWWHYTLRDEPYPDTYFDFPVE